MRNPQIMRIPSWVVLATVFCAFVSRLSFAASVQEIGPANRDPLQGKEVDWIDGDYVIANDQVIAVIARPGKLRDANMTVRGVGACLIDLTRRDVQSDQLSCYYPAAGRFRFFDDDLVEFGKLDDGGVFWRCRSSAPVAAGDREATIEYQLRDGDPFVTVHISISGTGIAGLKPIDGVRADRTFKFSALPGSRIAYCEDEYFRQTYGFECLSGQGTPVWSSDRLRQLDYRVESPEIESSEKSGRTFKWTTRVYPASSPLDLWGLAQGAAPQTFVVRGAVGDQPRIKLTLLDGIASGVKLPAVWRSAADGKSIVHLPSGTYRVRAEAIGHRPTEASIHVTDGAGQHSLTLGPATKLVGHFTDADGEPIPCKVTFYGVPDADGNPTKTPSFGLDSQSGSVGNCVYSADGQFIRSIPPGSYEVLITRGPEYDAIFEKIEVQEGQTAELSGTLKRVVDTTGWISAELHSHSTPSGDNTSDQLGRVENLLCEHLEFAPCTEHQRIESYDDQLEILGASRLMATCSGMELTGSPLPINHQNAFPLKWAPYQQGGGAPQTDTDPVAQIARLAMWDDNADKVVQSNHPNLRQMRFDRDLDGKEDGGFAKMFDYMDIIEIHPPEMIFLSDEETAKLDNPDANRIKPWMDLLLSGRRIPGVVNTDAHYNWHGSGWLRNWVRCSTDDPSEISTEEMIERLERGEIVMSTGPFLSVELVHPELEQPATIGDTVALGGQSARLAIKVQCANWLDINRVEVFVNGKMQPSLSRKRTEQPQAFGDGVVKFNHQLEVELPERGFVLVAVIGERLKLGRVFGDTYGNRPPVAVSNPIFVTPAGQ